MYRYTYRCPKLRLDLHSQKTISLLVTITWSLNIQLDKLVYRSDLETWILGYFPSKCLNSTAINFFLLELSTLIIRKFTISRRIDITLQTIVKYLREITMYSAFILGCAYDKSTINFIGDVYCPNTNFSGKPCRDKKTSASLGRKDFQCPECACVCQERKILFTDQTNFFFLSLGRGVFFFKWSPKSIQHVIGEMSFVLASIVSTERNANLLTVT